MKGKTGLSYLLFLFMLPAMTGAQALAAGNAAGTFEDHPDGTMVSDRTEGVVGSQVNTDISNTARGMTWVNASQGDASVANLASVVVENSVVNRPISNDVESIALNNVAAGKNSKANLCSVEVVNTTSNCSVANQVRGVCITNVALGDNSHANYGSVIVGSTDGQECPETREIVNVVNVGANGDVNIAEAGKTSNKNSVLIK